MGPFPVWWPVFEPSMQGVQCTSGISHRLETKDLGLPHVPEGCMPDLFHEL